MKDKKEFVKKIWAFTLGDGSLKKIDKNNGYKNSCYRIFQIEDHKDYLEWQASMLEELTAVNMYYRPAHIIKKTGYSAKGGYSLETRVHPLYTKMRNRIYPRGIKQIDPHYLKLLDWEVLAILYQDDGSLPKVEGRKLRCKICTNNYSYGDNFLLREAIKEKVGVLFDIRKYKSYYTLQATPNNTEVFIAGVAPYILPSFEYKIDLSSNEKLRSYSG